MTIYVNLLLAILGLLVYALAGNSKAAEAGRLTFAVGLLVFLFKLAPSVVHLP